MNKPLRRQASWPAYPGIYLASQSPRRQELLRQLGVRFELLLPEPGEDSEGLEAVRPGELPLAYVERVTLAKLQAARQRLKRRGGEAWPILAADTTVAIGRRILGKPADAAEARAMLHALSGRSHRVLTALAVVPPRGAALHTVHQSRVQFATLTPELIGHYIASGEPFGKAGAYAIQGVLSGWIRRIDGSHSGVMGLPLHDTAQLLHHFGVATSLTP